MLKSILTGGLIVISISLFAQKNNIQNTANALKHKELDKAKKAIDLAAEHEETRNDKKMWFYRGNTYYAINDDKDKFKDLDADAAEKAYLSYLNCLKVDKDNIYKEEVTPFLIGSAIRLYNKGIDAFQANQSEKATRYFTDIFEVFPFDKDKTLARNNITIETLNLNLYTVANSIKDNAKAKEYLQKLIDLKYKNPSIYLDMSRIMLEEKDTAKALSYIETGRNLFDDNASIIKAELYIYIMQNKIDILLNKINKAIETAPDIEMLHFVQGNIYEKKNEIAKAELAYKKAIELKPDYFEANFNLGALYYNKAVEWKNKGDNLSPSELSKAKDYDAKAEMEFKNALSYLEKANTLNATDNAVIQSLLKIYKITGDNDKYNKLKASLEKK